MNALAFARVPTRHARVRAPRRILNTCTFPRFLPVRQHFPDHRIPDVPGEVQKQLAASGFASRATAWRSRRDRRRQPGHRQHRDHRARGGGLLEIARRPAVHLSRHGQPRRGHRRRPGRRAGALRHPSKPPWAVRSSARWTWFPLGKTAGRHRSLHGPQRLRERRRDADRPREVAHRLRGQDRKRPVQDDGHRSRQVRRSAALSHLRLQAGPGARHPQRRAAGADVGKDSGRPGDSRRRQSQHRRSLPRCRWKKWSATKRSCWRW